MTRTSKTDHFRGRVKKPIDLGKEIEILDDDDESVVSQEQITKPSLGPELDLLALSHKPTTVGSLSRKPTTVGSKASQNSVSGVSDISPDSSPTSLRKRNFRRGGWFTEECLKEPDTHNNSRASFMS